MTDIVGLGKLADLRKERMQLAPQLGATFLMRRKNCAHVLKDLMVVLGQGLGEFLDQLAVSRSTFHGSPTQSNEGRSQDQLCGPGVREECLRLVKNVLRQGHG